MKNYRKIFTMSALVFIALLLYSQSTFAAYITYEDTYSGSGNYFNNTFELQKFDSSLGTLQSVVFTWDGILDGSLGVEANSSSVWYTMNNFTANVNLNKPGPGGGVWSNSTVSPPSETVYTSYTWDDINAVVIDEEMLFTDASDLSWFTGSGNFELSLLGWFGLSKNQEGYWAENPLISLAEGKVTVTYEYDGAPVPEPSTFLLFGAGLLGLTGVVRRKIKK